MFEFIFPAGTNSELSNASETEEIADRDSRPRGVERDDRGSKRGGRGRGSIAGKGRGGQAPRNTNTISSGRYITYSVYILQNSHGNGKSKNT